MRALRVAATLAAVLLLAGCATIPTTGPVQTPGPVRAEKDPSIVFIPAGPADNATPEDIVNGFVQAAGAGAPFTVAKQFLTEARARVWQPAHRVLVQEDSGSAPVVSGSRAVLRVPITAQVDADGVYTPSYTQSRQPATVRVDFTLVRVGGQWRISDVPDEVIVSQRAFPRVFGSPIVLQYFDPAYARFVPDLRWRFAPHRPSDAVAALLTGRSALLAGSVATTAFPAGTRLAAPVEVSGGRTTVSLTTDGAPPDRTTTDRMQQQLARTLGAGGVAPASIRLVVDGRTAPAVTGAGPEPQAASQSPLVVASGRFGTFSASGLREDGVFGPRIVQQRPRAITVSQRQSLAAVLTGAGKVALLGRSGGAKVIDSRPRLVAPSVDQRNWTYSVPSNDPAALWATLPSGRKRELSTGLLGSEVFAIEVSPDGTRMLALVQTETGPFAYVAGIERDGSGAPVGLTTAIAPVVFTADAVFDATWTDGSTIAVLAGSGDAQIIATQQVGGVSRTLGLPYATRSIAAATQAQGGVRALTNNGDLVVRPTNVWQSEFSDPVAVQVLAVQR